jgi:RHS repeat-associated protein
VTSVSHTIGSTDTYEYDANGNMTCRVEEGITYIQTYNTENRIASIAKLESGTCAGPGNYVTKWDFTYDGDGTRAATLTTPYTSGTPGTPVLTAYYFGGAYEVTGSNVRKYYSFEGQSILRDNEGLQYLLNDHLGSVMGIIDDEGILTSQQRYLPFGGVRQLESSFITQTDYGYTGQRDNSYIKLMDYDFRWYSTGLGRFISPDSIIPEPTNPQSLNRYSYVINRPLNFNDPTGHKWGECKDSGYKCQIHMKHARQEVADHNKKQLKSFFENFQAKAAANCNPSPCTYSFEWIPSADASTNLAIKQFLQGLDDQGTVDVVSDGVAGQVPWEKGVGETGKFLGYVVAFLQFIKGLKTAHIDRAADEASTKIDTFAISKPGEKLAMTYSYSTTTASHYGGPSVPIYTGTLTIGSYQDYQNGTQITIQLDGTTALNTNLWFIRATD